MYNIKSKVFLMLVVRAHGEVKIWLHSFLPSVLDVKKRVKMHPSTGTEALYRPYGP